MQVALETYDAHNEIVKVHREAEITAHAMLSKKVEALEAALNEMTKALQVSSNAKTNATSDRSKAKQLRTFPKFDAHHPEIFCGPGHAKMG